MIKIIYSFDKNVHSDELYVNNTKNFYKRSIYDAKNFGHITEMYSNDKEFEDWVDVFHFKNDKPLFWDEYKFYALEREDDFVLADGDIIWHTPFNVNRNVDVYFDSYEEFNWKSLYEVDVNTLTYLEIDKVIPEWDGKRRAAFCCGILGFNNKELQALYLDRYKKFRDIVRKHRNMLDVSKCTAVGAQYLLASIVDTQGYSHYAYSKTPRTNNGIYTHYAGKKKLTDPFIPLTEKHLF